ncbi:MAG: 50S ribosomal protein L13, partial [Patescibacteria group bacterium]
DAKGEILGRLSSKIAQLLTGKGKPTYSPHMDSGDYVVVINAEKIEVTGKKKTQKLYRSHSGYPGGFKEATFAKMSLEKPEEIIKHAVMGMLPDNRLKKDRLTRLKIVKGDKNPYQDKWQK